MNNDNEERIAAYFEVIDNHIIRPIAETDVRFSCIATLMLLFASIDGLGKLIHPDENASVSDRFKAFLSRMGSQYAINANKIYELRNSLLHNALNTESHMAVSQVDGNHHLKELSPFGLLFINTSQFFTDFCHAKDALRNEITKNSSLHTSAASRLEWVKDDPQEYWKPCSTPPGPVCFIAERNRTTI